VKPISRPAALFLVFAAVAGCASEPPVRCAGDEVLLRTQGELRVATDMDFPPFAFRDDEGAVTGFEIELLQELSDRMSLELRLVSRGAAALIPGVIAQRYDLAASALTDDPELAGETCASRPYMPADLAVLVPAPDPRAIGGVRDLAGRTVAVWQGTGAEDWVRENLPSAAVVAVPTTDDLLDALDDRTAHAAIVDLAIARFLDARSTAHAVADEIDLGETYVFVAAADNGPLIAEIDAALQELEDEGWLEDLRREWFGS
jgi:polar amino acid transport system substrate-binding protein